LAVLSGFVGWKERKDKYEGKEHLRQKEA
jgi:hypothetical protein